MNTRAMNPYTCVLVQHIDISVAVKKMQGLVLTSLIELFPCSGGTVTFCPYVNTCDHPQQTYNWKSVQTGCF